ncbi:MAG: pyruvate ferredoxin oxidoreductase [Desulfobacteraceae bacterium 4484_190.3]|nr:MAG: pyruvate ferredoxin oxidoreductase [Desulfobacteraceae bacterium 4484_190.3]
MIEIRFHGRGGQGTVIASILLAKALFQAGYQVQSFPVFGVERRGAPVEAYVRFDKENILIRTNVYNPDHVVVQDCTLLQNIDVTRGLKPEGWIIINSPVSPDDLAPFTGFKLAFVDANGIALRNHLGTRTHPIVNTPMIGVFARVFNMPSMDAVEAAIREEVPAEVEGNIKAAQDAYNEVQLIGLIKEAVVDKA